MISILKSNATEPNHLFQPDKRVGRENNISWLERNIPYRDEDHAHILLIGGKNSNDFRLRVAQSHLRQDLVPSHWSHAALIGKLETNLAATTVYEISLEPKQGFGFPPPQNGIQEGELNQYRSPIKYPNIAIFGVTVPKESRSDSSQSFLDQLLDALKRFEGQRPILDAVELTLRWLAFVWGAAGTGNPLHEGYGIPSAAMLEIVLSTVGFDLTPGLESRASCPEAIWQSAKWWHQYYEQENQAGCLGAYHIGQRLNI